MDNYTSGVSTDCSPSSSFALTGKVMLSSVVILFTVVAVIVFLHSYARWLLRRDRSRRRRSRGRGRTRTQSDPDRVAALDAGIDFGLDFSILKSLPTFVYSKAADGPTLECAVCLSEFEEDEKGRVLPECDHCFHNDCIEMWFHSHSNCPLCRAPVHLHIPSPAEPVERPTATEAISPRSPRDDEEGDKGPSPGTLPLVECPRTPLELVGISITVEEVVPAGARVEEGCKEREEEGTTESQSSEKSPGSRIMSLKRIWSIQQHNL